MTQPKDTQNEAKQAGPMVCGCGRFKGESDLFNSFCQECMADLRVAHPEWFYIPSEKLTPTAIGPAGFIATCETNGHLFAAIDGSCIFCAAPKEPTAIGPDTDCDPGLPSAPFRDNFTEAASFAGITFSQGCQFWLMMQHLLGNGPKPGFLATEKDLIEDDFDYPGPTAIPAQEAKSGWIDVNQEILDALEVAYTTLTEEITGHQWDEGVEIVYAAIARAKGIPAPPEVKK